MTATALCKRVLPSLVTVTLVGLLVVGVAWALVGQGSEMGQGSEAVRVATGGVIAGWLIVLAAELAVVMLGVLTQTEVAPVSRMMLTMLVRGGGAMVAIAVGVVGMQYEPRMVAWVAIAIYASLVISEVMEAMALARLNNATMPTVSATTGRAS